MLTLKSWPMGAAAPKRIYVNNLAGRKTAYFTTKKGSTNAFAVVENGGDSAEVERIVAQTFQLSTPLAWDDVVAIAKTDFRRVRGKQIDVRQTVAGTHAAGLFSDQAALAIDEDLKTFPIPVETILLADHREPDELIDRLSRFTNLTVERTTLETADFAVPNIISFERKTARDFGLSITEVDKRLFHQLERLRQEPGRTVVLIEGDLYGDTNIGQPHIDGALSYITLRGGIPIRTMSLPHTAYMIALFLRHAVHGLGQFPDLRGAAPAKAPASEKALFVAEGLPGISTRLAMALLAHFGSLQALANASEQELRAVDGIGAGKAAAIAATFQTKTTT